MALFGVVPDYGVVSDYDPRDKCMTEGPAWLINVFDGNRIYGKGQLKATLGADLLMKYAQNASKLDT